MLRRFVQWPGEERRILAEINGQLADMTPAERDPLFEDGCLDPSIDPTFLFDMNHPFPGIAEVRKRLAQRFGVKDVMREQEEEPLATGDLVHSTWATGMGTLGHDARAVCRYAVFEHEDGQSISQDGEHGLRGPRRVLLDDSLDFPMQWTLPIVEGFDPDHDTWVAYTARTGEPPYVWAGLLGVFTPNIARWFAEFLGCREVERWAKRVLLAGGGLRQARREAGGASACLGPSIAGPPRE
jgi:hypothetical protein